MEAFLKQTLLLVEDNIELAAWLDELLVNNEYQVFQCHRGDLVLPMLAEVNPGLGTEFKSPCVYG